MLVGKLGYFATLEQGCERRLAWGLPSMGSLAVCKAAGRSSSAEVPALCLGDSWFINSIHMDFHGSNNVCWPSPPPSSSLQAGPPPVCPCDNHPLPEQVPGTHRAVICLMSARPQAPCSPPCLQEGLLSWHRWGDGLPRAPGCHRAKWRTQLHSVLH